MSEQSPVGLLGDWLVRELRRCGPGVCGLCGAPGSGKTTLSIALKKYLESQGIAACVLSLDDFYLPRVERQRLARAVHPLLATRGVPGTHEVRYAMELLRRLKSGSGFVRLPQFDKALDDRVDEARWPSIASPAEVVLFEGWCLGALPEPACALAVPLNALERQEDPDVTWRRWVNHQLGEGYRLLFEKVDRWVFLEAPAFDVVLEWREEQEAQLRLRAPEGVGVMSSQEVSGFVQHFERTVRHMLTTMPSRADVTISLGRSRGVQSLSWR